MSRCLSVCLSLRLSLCLRVCVCFLEIMTAQQKIVDSYARLRCANSSGSKSGKLLVHAANIGNSGPKPASAYVFLPAHFSTWPQELAESSALGRMHMQVTQMKLLRPCTTPIPSWLWAAVAAAVVAVVAVAAAAAVAVEQSISEQKSNIDLQSNPRI